MVTAGLVESAHDCSEGGIAVTLAESGFAKGIGINVNLASQGLPAECALFGEDASRIVISCDQNHLSAIQQIAVKYKVSSEKIGETIPENFEIKLDGRVVVSAKVSELRTGFESALENALKADPELVAV
jgi:phosphoribosylformylglycinamidine synthase